MKRWRAILAAAIVAAAAILSYVSGYNESLIVDEIPHIGAGFSYVKTGQMRLNPEHPPLVKDLAGLALLPLHLKENVLHESSWQKNVNDQWNFGRSLIFGANGNNPDGIRFVARLPMLIFFIIGGWIVWRWTRELYDEIAALIAIFIYSLSPTILAHAHFVTTDVAALTGVLAASYYFWHYLQKPSAKNIILAGVVLGLALLTKFSTFLLVPFFVFVALIWYIVHPIDNGWQFTKRIILLITIAFVVVVWPVYTLHTFKYPTERQQSDLRQVLSGYSNRNLANLIVKAAGIPGIRSLTQYGAGLMMANQRTHGGNTVYFLGTVYDTGRPLYFPVVYIIKEPIAWLITLLIALSVFSWRFTKNKITNWLHFAEQHFAELFMLTWILLYWTMSITSTLNIGIRHLLPVYGFMYILAAGQIAWLLQKAQTHKVVAIQMSLIALAVWLVISIGATFPYYLAYFNGLAGGSAGGYRYVVDSNLDWGQDLIRFAQWVKKEDISKISMDYFGWADPSYYLGQRYQWINSRSFKDTDDFKAHNTSNGWLAISATFMQNSPGSEKHPWSPNYLWLKNHQPVVVIGHSIFVYHIQ